MAVAFQDPLDGRYSRVSPAPTLGSFTNDEHREVVETNQGHPAARLPVPRVFAPA